MSTRYADSMKRGKAAEDRFVKMAEARGFTVAHSRKNDDIFRHIDFIVVQPNPVGGEGVAKFVDVKARKRISRNDEDAQDQEIWLEIKNVGGNNGWVYSEGYVAFENLKGFVIVEKATLRRLIDELVSNELVTSATNALYKRYSRRGRKDLLTRVRISDIVARGEVWHEEDF